MKLKIMTNNIWGDYFGNPVSVREGGIFETYEKYAPDVLGFQEVTKNWYSGKMFSEWLTANYELVGSEAGGCKNYVPMAFRKDKGFVVLEKGYMLLPETPDDSKAITFVVLKACDGTVFAVCNTHFWWMRGEEEHNVNREKNAKQLSRLMHALHERFECPVFAFGDMNGAMPETLFDVYRKNGIKALIEMTDERDTACSIHGDPRRGDDGFYHGTRVTREYLERHRKLMDLTADESTPDYLASIDHIIGMGDNFKVLQYRVIEHQDALDATDHSPVFADGEFI